MNEESSAHLKSAAHAIAGFVAAPLFVVGFHRVTQGLLPVTIFLIVPFLLLLITALTLSRLDLLRSLSRGLLLGSVAYAVFLVILVTRFASSADLY
jgi:hypothetical protein